MSQTENLEKFRKVIAGVGAALSGILFALSALIFFIPGLQPVGAGLATTAASIGAISLAVTGIGTAFAGFTASSALAAGESESLTKIFAALSEALDEIMNSMSYSIGLFGLFSDSVSEGGSALDSLIFFIKGAGTVISFFVRIIDILAVIGTVIAGLVMGIVGIVGNIIDFIGPILSGIVVLVTTIGLLIGGVVTSPAWGTAAAIIGGLTLVLMGLHDILFERNSPILWNTLLSFGKAVAKSFMNLNPVTGVLMTLVDSLTLVKDTIFAVKDSFAMLLKLATSDLTPVVEAFQEMGSSMESVKNLPVEKIQALTTGGAARGGQVQQIVEREIIRDVKFVIGDREFKEVVNPIADARFNKLSTSFIV